MSSIFVLSILKTLVQWLEHKLLRHESGVRTPWIPFFCFSFLSGFVLFSIKKSIILIKYLDLINVIIYLSLSCFDVLIIN